MSKPPDSFQGELDRIVFDYLQAVERGEEIPFEKVVGENPRFAKELAEFGEDNRRMQSAVAEFDLVRPQMLGAKTISSIESHTFRGQASSCTSLGARIEAVRFGEYHLVRELGAGGMGVVYEAFQPKLNRRVALKVSRHRDDSQAEDLVRFQFEAEAAAQLDHPHIDPVLDSGQHEGRHYIIMKLIDGKSLKQTPRGSQREEVQRMIQVADAVQHAHDQGILHRDLKPSNIILDASGTPFVADFGLAKSLDVAQGLTRTGASLETPQYMSPEQAAGTKRLSVASDLYALGVILFERICGHALYEDEAALCVIRKVQLGATPNLHRLTAACDRELRTIIRKCVELNPSDRYVSCRELAQDLQRWLQGEPISSRSISPAERGFRWMRRHPWQSIGGSTIALGVALSIGLMVVNAQTNWRWRITEYARHVQLARAELSEHYPGWKDRAYSSIEVAEKLVDSPENARELASLRASCDLGFDIGKPKFTIPQTNTIAVQFHPTKPLLFLARKYARENENACPLLVVDTGSGKIVHELRVSDTDAIKPCGIRAMVITTDGDELAVLTTTSKLYVYAVDELASGQPKTTMALPPLQFTTLVAVEGAEALILGGRSVETEVWQVSSINTKSWTVSTTRELPEGLRSLAAAADIQRVILCDAKQLQVIHPVSLVTTWAPIPIDSVGEIAYHGGRVAVNSSRGVSLYDVQHPDKICDLEPPPGGFPSSHWDAIVSFSNQGDLLAAGDRERHQVHIWSTTDCKYLQTVSLDDSMYRNVSFDFSSDELLAASGGSETIVAPIHPSSMTRIVSSSGPIVCIDFASERQAIVVQTRHSNWTIRGDITCYQLQHGMAELTNATVIEGVPEYYPSMLTISPDDCFLAATIAENNNALRIQVLDANKLALLGKTPNLSGFRNTAFDSSGRLLATADSGLVSLSEDFSTVERHWTRPQIAGALQGSKHYPVLQLVDDEHIFVGDEDGWFIKLFWSESPRSLSTVRLGTAPLRVSALHYPAGVIAVGDGNGDLYGVSTASGQRLHRQAVAHRSGATALAWTDSGHLVSAGLDQTLRFWNWDRGANVLRDTLTLRLRGNVRQIIPVLPNDSHGPSEELIILREGAYAVERLRLSKNLFE